MESPRKRRKMDASMHLNCQSANLPSTPSIAIGQRAVAQAHRDDPEALLLICVANSRKGSRCANFGINHAADYPNTEHPTEDRLALCGVHKHLVSGQLFDGKLRGLCRARLPDGSNCNNLTMFKPGSWARCILHKEALPNGAGTAALCFLALPSEIRLRIVGETLPQEVKVRLFENGGKRISSRYDPAGTTFGSLRQVSKQTREDVTVQFNLRTSVEVFVTPYLVAIGTAIWDNDLLKLPTRRVHTSLKNWNEWVPPVFPTLTLNEIAHLSFRIRLSGYSDPSYLRRKIFDVIVASVSLVEALPNVKKLTVRVEVANRYLSESGQDLLSTAKLLLEPFKSIRARRTELQGIYTYDDVGLPLQIFGSREYAVETVREADAIAYHSYSRDFEATIRSPGPAPQKSVLFPKYELLEELVFKIAAVFRTSRYWHRKLSDLDRRLSTARSARNARKPHEFNEAKQEILRMLSEYTAWRFAADQRENEQKRHRQTMERDIARFTTEQMHLQQRPLGRCIRNPTISVTGIQPIDASKLETSAPATNIC